VGDTRLSTPGAARVLVLQRKIETTKNTKVHENQRVETGMPFTL